MNRLSRKLEVNFLKEEISSMIKELGISKALYKRNLPRVSFEGYKYEVASGIGHKPSLRQQYTFLKDLIKYNNEKKEKEDAK